jgi:hypothetical protein
VLHEERRLPIEMVLVNIVYFIFGVIIAITALRFVLLLLGANASAGFTRMVYQLSAPLMAPFAAVFGETRASGSVFEWSALLAIVIYALVAWGIASLISAVTPRESAGTVEYTEESHTDSEREGIGEDRHEVITDENVGPTRDVQR